jgi:hypothetical protein
MMEVSHSFMKAGLSRLKTSCNPARRIHYSLFIAFTSLYFGNRRCVYVEEINNYRNLKPCTVSGMMTNMLVLNNNWSIARRRKKTSALVASDHKEKNRYGLHTVYVCNP